MKLTRREAIRLGLMGGGGLLLSQAQPDFAWAVADLSPQIPRFERKFKHLELLPPVKTYERRERPLDVYEITMQKANLDILPGLTTEVWSYNGMVPGPLIRQRGGFKTKEDEGIDDNGRSSMIRFINKLGTTIENGEEVPIKTTIHLHGMASLPQYDGYAEDLICPNYYKDYFYPNDRAATIWYHDHAIDKTSRNVYMGLAGMYIVTDEEERQLVLPKDKYDVPLVLQDMQFNNKGQLVFDNRHETSLYADVVLVNGVPWPRMEVDHRKYRFRVLNASTSRGYQLILSRKEDRLTAGDWLHVIATDCGLIEKPVKVGIEGGLEQPPSKNPPPPVLEIWPAERYEFVIDFSQYEPGTSLYLQNPRLRSSNNIDSDTRVLPLMRFHVTDNNPDRTPLPKELRLIEDLTQYLPAKQQQTLEPNRRFIFGRSNKWTINNKLWNKDRVDANPKPGAVEIWELFNAGGSWMHPIHIHFADWQILSRDGNPALPYEQGWKDVFRVGRFEKVRVIAEFGRRGGDSVKDKYVEGKFMFHCHNLVHEDHSMMTQFEIGKCGASPFCDPPKPISEMVPYDDATIPESCKKPTPEQCPDCPSEEGCLTDTPKKKECPTT